MVERVMATYLVNEVEDLLTRKMRLSNKQVNLTNPNTFHAKFSNPLSCKRDSLHSYLEVSSQTEHSVNIPNAFM